MVARAASVFAIAAVLCAVWGPVLPDSITRIQWGVAVADGRADLLAHVTRFLDGAKSAGIVQDAIDRHKVEGARVAR